MHIFLFIFTEQTPPVWTSGRLGKDTHRRPGATRFPRATAIRAANRGAQPLPRRLGRLLQFPCYGQATLSALGYKATLHANVAKVRLY